MKPNLFEIYEILFDQFGPQGWWPLVKHDGTNPTKSGSHTGYHPGDYSFPKNREEQFEIAVGAVLTQNTAWTNVEKALHNLFSAELLHDPRKITAVSDDHLKELIRPAGYYNQKCSYLKTMADFFVHNPGTPSRNQLLALRGVGEETADAVLLYAFSVPSFTVDAYTRRFLQFHEILSGNESYRSIQTLFHDSLPADPILFQEYHALIVELGKRSYSRKPYGDSLF